jgi:hypothetical protein
LNNQVAISLDQLANNNVSRVQQTQAQPFNYDNVTPGVSNVQAGQLNNGPQVGQVQSSVNQGPIQGSLDYSKLTALPGTQDFSADASKVANSVYQQAASRLDPQYAQSDSDLKSSLAAQGISENSDAYRRAQDNQARAKTDAYNQANYSAIQAGGAEQSRIFGLDMSARQQGQNEVNTQGQFANTAQSQQFDQAQQIAQLFNQSQQQQFSQGQAAASMQNANQNTAFNEGGANAALANSSRQQQIQEQTYLRNLPLNDIAALLGTGAQVQQPNFNPVSQVGVAAPDYAGMVQSNYNTAVNQANNAQNAQASMLGSIFGTAGTAAMAFSDRRFKENIRRIGTLANGLATYAFQYIGNAAQQFGVMAQEVLGVMPDAVHTDRDGRMFVDYRKVYA